MTEEETQKMEEICDEYLSKQQLYHDFSELINYIISQIIGSGEIKIYTISHREKDPEKLREKIIRKASEGKKYGSLEEIEDLAGVRVVTYLESHRELAENLIYRAFEDSRPDIVYKGKPEGYKGTHFIFTLGKTREELLEYSRYVGLKCEVQVKSILFHAWSEIEHDVIYKPGDDRKKLISLGLGDVEKSFQEIMAQHMEDATIKFDLLYKKYNEILRAGRVIFSDFVSDIRNAQSNDEIASMLDIADKFSHKKPEEAIQMVEEVIRSAPIDPRVIHRFSDKELFGKSRDDILEKCIDILSQFNVRYWDTERILLPLFLLALNQTKKIEDEAIKAIKNTVKYNRTYIKESKNLYPQMTALEFIKKISLEDRRKNLVAITTISEEILLLAVEGVEYSSVDTLTFSPGALVPSAGLKKMRQETIDFVAELFEQLPYLKERLMLMRVLLAALEAPHNAEHVEGLYEIVREDSKRLADVFTKLVFPADEISNYLIAQEIERTLIQLLRDDDFRSTEIQALCDRFKANADYRIFCTLVGDISEYKNPDEDWHDAESRRSDEIKALIEAMTEEKQNEWYKKLNDFTEPLKTGVVDEWKYNTFRMFIGRFTEEKLFLATAILKKAIEEGSALAQESFIAAHLTALRRMNDIASWDSFVALICEKKLSNLASSIIASLNLIEGVDLNISIRDEDVKVLAMFVSREEPFEFVNDDDLVVRRMLVSTLARIFSWNPSRIEALIIQEMKGHPKFVNAYFQELPFVSGRKWMSFGHWSANGIEFIKQQLVILGNLDWHTQGMMLELVADPIHIILEVFKKRIQKEKKDEQHYEVIPYHFNPDFKKYITKDERYVTEMVEWLKNMTPDWSTYNWNVTHFIQRIGGASYSSILLKLIENEDKASLKKAAYALNGLKVIDFDLCFEIVKKTDEEDILNQVGGAMSSTGVVSGEDGLARAFELKAKRLDTYSESEDTRIKAFAIKMKKTFEESAQREYQYAGTRKKTREIEFRG